MKFSTTLKKGNGCHRGTWSIMANAGEWSPLVIKLGDQVFQLPRAALKKNGQLKKLWAEKIRGRKLALVSA